MNAMAAFVRNEPVWLQALVLAVITIAGRYGFHLDADSLVAVNVIAYAVLAFATRLMTMPVSKALTPPAPPPQQ